jgi:hypothetical protein
MLFDNLADRAAKRQFNANIGVGSGPHQDEMMLGS